MDFQRDQFQDVLRLVRSGDPHAISKFVAKYEPFIRRTMRFRLARASLHSAADSVDVCQSVFGSLFIRLFAGEYELATEEDLSKLLYSIANNKFIALQRRELAKRRDRRQTVSLNTRVELADERQMTPERTTSLMELISKFESSLEPEEQELYQLRKQGQTWSSIATQVGENPIVLRKRLSRAVKRVAMALGIEDL